MSPREVDDLSVRDFRLLVTELEREHTSLSDLNKK